MKKLFLLSILTFAMVAALLPTGLFAQDTESDSCTIYIGTGYYSQTSGWGGGYIELLCNGYSFKTIQHQQWTPNTYAANVPSNDSIVFRWHQGSVPVSFFIKNAANEVIYTCSTSPQEGIFLSFHPCGAPRNVGDLSIVPTTDSTAVIAWTNPVQTINNAPIEVLRSVEILGDGRVLRSFTDPIPGHPMQFVDSTWHAGKFYTFTVYSDIARSKPIEATGPSCHYRLQMQTNRVSWFGHSVNLYSEGHLLGKYTLTSRGPETVDINLPLGIINIQQTGIDGTFSIINDDDVVVFSGPAGMTEDTWWYNGCSLEVPDSVSGLTLNRQDNVMQLTWTTPTQSVDENPLDALTRVEVRRNNKLIRVLTNIQPGTAVSVADTVDKEGTFRYSVQCFNSAGGGVPAFSNAAYGTELVLYDQSQIGCYSDSLCSFSIGNDSLYTIGGKTTLTFVRSDRTKMWKLSGGVTRSSNAEIEVSIGDENNMIPVTWEDSLFCSYPIVKFEVDIKPNTVPLFHFDLTCVNSLYEQPDTTIAILPDTNGIIYVTETGAGLKDGSSWSNATPWLNRALETADTMATKPVLWVAKGTYYGNPQLYDNETYAFVGRAGVNAYGGFAGNEPADYNLSLRDFEQNETVLDGLQEHTVVYLNGCEWNGFHIQRGVNGCVMKRNSILRECGVTDCIYNGVLADYVSSNPSIIIDQCHISRNNDYGINANTVSVTKSEILYNGYGVRGSGYLNECIIANNRGIGYTAPYTGAPWTLINCVVANNDGVGCELVQNTTILNCIIVNNSGAGIKGRANCRYENCIIWGNGGAAIYEGYGYGNNYNLRNCALDGIWKCSGSNIPLSSPDAPDGIQPGFVNPTAGAGSAYSGGDWHLLPTSVCINRGSTAVNNFPETDLEGNARIRQGIPDIGAYESDYTLVEENHFIHPDTNKIIYVKEEGTGDGSSWQNATSDLRNAIEVAWLYGPNTQIWVAQGNYPTPNTPFYLKENLKLFGGFEGNEPADYPIDLRNTVEHPAVLNGLNYNRVLHQTFDFENGAVIDGFTLTNGTADEGAGAYLMAGTTLSKCRIVNNTAGENGAALYAVRDTLLQLIVENNNGTGVAAENAQLFHCTVVKNSADGVRLSVASVYDSCLLRNSLFWGNGQQNIRYITAIAFNNTSTHYCAIGNQMVAGIGNIALSDSNANEAGPHFITPTDTVGIINILGDWQLDSSSVCVNAGAVLLDYYNLSTDIAGQPRVQNGSADIGVWESSFKHKAFYRTEEVFLYDGENYSFYDTTLTTSGWYEHRWNVGDVDSVVTLHLIVKGVVYVSVEGAGDRDGSSWANALDGGTATENGSTKLADALAEAIIGTDFWIQSGTYYACSDSDVNKSLTLNEGVGIYGGFAGTESALDQRDTNNAPTVFSGNLQNDSLMENYSRNIFKTNELNTLNTPIILNQISITEGYNDIHTGTALHIGNTSEIRAERCRFHHNFGSAISNEGLFKGYYCLIDSNTSLSTNYSDKGASAFFNQQLGVIVLKKCNVFYNEAARNGAVFNDGCMQIDSSDISYNTATTYFTGAIRNNGKLLITNSYLSHNYSWQMYSTIESSGLFKMENCSIEYNECQRCNPLYYWPYPRHTFNQGSNSAHIVVKGEGEISHCIFSHNSQNAGQSGGCLHINGNATVRNCDFIENMGTLPSNSPYVSFESSSSAMIVVVFYAYGNGDGGGIHVEDGNVFVEDCSFDRQIGQSGSSACVESGRMLMNRCSFTRNNADDMLNGDNGVLAVYSGELVVQNSLFANNENPIFNTPVSTYSGCRVAFSNCTFSNNGNKFLSFCVPGGANADGFALSPSGTEYIRIGDTAFVKFNNCIITGGWDIAREGIGVSGYDHPFYVNYSVDFTNTLFDSVRTAPFVDVPSENIVPDSAGNIYYCNPMFVNPSVMQGIDTISDWSQVDFRLREGSPCINSGVLEGTDFTEESTDLAGERRIKQCAIDRGCYEFGSTVFADTLYETLCMEANSVEGFVYTGHGFTIPQPEVGTSLHSRNSACEDTVYTLLLDLQLISHTEDYLEDCDSVVWHDNIFTESGEYVRTIPSFTGCDSIVTLHVTVHHSVTEPVEVTICEDELPYYYVNGEIDTTFDIGTPNLSTFNFSLSTQYGCDSTVTLTLTIEPCDTTCIAEANTADITLYPNPTTGIVNVHCSMDNAQSGNVEIRVYDVYGKLIETTHALSPQPTAQINLSNYAAGIYIVKLVNDKKVMAVQKVVKE